MNRSALVKELKALCGEAIAEEIFRLSAALPDPSFFILNALRIAERAGAEDVTSVLLSKDTRSLLVPLLSSSQFLTGLLVKQPECFRWLFIEGAWRVSLSLTELQEEISGALGQEEGEGEVGRILRRVRDREILRVAVRDLSGLAKVEETTASLSDLAEAALSGASSFACSYYRRHFGRPLFKDEGNEEGECGFCVLALGKFGGRELNFSSDIDIMYIYESAWGTVEGERGEVEGARKETSLHHYFIKVAEMVTRLIGEITEDGMVFRVDLRLRPDGSRGPLANSLRGLESYYESWGQTWERAALIKIRPVAGDLSLGERAIKMLTPFVYRKYLDFEAIDEVKDLKKRIDISLKVKMGNMWDVKLGDGGIREIEFFIQAHQLIFGGKHPEIRERNALKALVALRDSGYISSVEGEEVATAYRFLRNLEHRIQMLGGMQTQLLPEGKDLEKVSYLMGFSSLDDFTREMEKVRKTVSVLFGKLFVSDKDEREIDVDPEVISLLYGDIPSEKGESILASMGFRDTPGALENLEYLRKGPPFSRLTDRARKYLRTFAPVILSKASRAADPDMALANTETFIQAIGARTTFYALLSENPSIIEPLIQLFGSSRFLTRYFVNRPELIDVLLQRGQSALFKDRFQMRAELGEELVLAEGIEEELGILRRYRNEEFLRVGIHTLGGNLSLEELSVQLSALAEVSMGFALFLAGREVEKRYGIPSYQEEGETKESRISVLALGKFGGEELNFHSDLDILFIFSHMGETRAEGEGKEEKKSISNQEYFARLAQRFISNLSTITKEGFVYKVDMRLRPSGTAGPLVTSYDAFRQYYLENAWLFEKQALIRARPVAGDREFGKEVLSWINRFVYESPPPEELGEKIREIRSRMEKELGKEREGFYNVKFGKGGLIDVEFLTQYLQILKGKDNPPVRTPNTLKALYELKREGTLDNGDFQVLNGGYRFLREIEVRLRLLHDTSVERFLPDDRGLKLLHYESVEEFETEYRKKTGAIREVYEKILGG